MKGRRKREEGGGKRRKGRREEEEENTKVFFKSEKHNLTPSASKTQIFPNEKRKWVPSGWKRHLQLRYKMILTKIIKETESQGKAEWIGEAREGHLRLRAISAHCRPDERGLQGQLRPCPWESSTTPGGKRTDSTSNGPCSMQGQWKERCKVSGRNEGQAQTSEYKHLPVSPRGPTGGQFSKWWWDNK